MTGTDAPRLVRLAAKLTMALAPVGLLLLLDGLMELQWRGTTDAHALVALLDKIQADYGIEPPELLRGRGGAIQLVVLGAVCLAYSSLGIWLLRGSAWARTTALVMGVAAVLFGLFGVGIDSTETRTLANYFADLNGSAIGDQGVAVRALLYPGWYSWAEDIVQGLQVILSLVALAALAWAVISHSDWFTGRRNADAAPDEWDSALSRVREQSRKHLEADS
ncbi:hypothetical protein ACIA5D_36010 [Actinoplanes sp. NPDC051513]|uniref:hypothetical protein n=1 Tax=Actinoplanes sp. NPDC051513 TaxID=3363908 RepID=UPI0037981839